MKSNVLLASLIAAVSLHTGAMAQAASEPSGDKPAEAAAAEPVIAAPERKARPRVKREALAPDQQSTERFGDFFRPSWNARSAGPGGHARSASASAQGQG